MSSGRTVADIGEFGLIERIAARTGSETALVGIGDDAAVLDLGAGDLTLVTTDMLVQDVHFRLPATPGEVLGRQALAVNLSDIAAMGGLPRYAFISLALPPDTSVDFVDALYTGLQTEAEAFGVEVAGGNITRTSGPLAVDIALVGTVPRGEVVLRSGGQPGDLLAVTGPLGNRAAARLLAEKSPVSLDPGPPVPRIHLARRLAARHLVKAMIDLSDGLGSDLHHLASASGCGAVLAADALPVGSVAQSYAATPGSTVTGERLALYGGEDYELLVAIAPQNLDAAREVAGRDSFHVVGRLTDPGDAVLIDREGELSALPANGWRHF